MKNLLFILIIIAFTFAVKAQNLDDYLIYDKPAEKQLALIKTFNVNEIALRIKSGTIYSYNKAGYNTKLYIQNTGLKDYSGNEVLVPFAVKEKDTVFLFPDPWFHPIQYRCYSTSKIFQNNLVSQWKGIDNLFDTERLNFYGSIDLFKKGPDGGITSRIKKNLNKREDLLYQEFDKCIEMTNKYFDLALDEIKKNGYSKTLDKTMDGIFVTREVKYWNSTDKHSIAEYSLKVKKIYDNNSLKEIILMFPFSDGSFPDKEEFLVHVKKNEDGFFVVPENKWIYSGVLIPVNGVVLILEKKTYYEGGKNVNSVKYVECLTKTLLDYNTINTIKELKGKGSYLYDYETWYKKKNVTLTHDYKENGLFDNFINNIFYPEILKTLK